MILYKIKKDTLEQGDDISMIQAFKNISEAVE